MRANSGTWFMLAGLAAAIALNSSLAGAEPKEKDDAADNGAAAAGDDGGAKKKERPTAAKDPVASAFALPKGVVLNPAQQSAYDDLKQKYEAELRQAFDDVQQADGAAATSAALKEVRESRAKIRAGIQDILAMPYHAAVEKSGGQPSSGSGSGGSSSGEYYPAGYYPGGYYGGYYYPGGYYPGGYYPYAYYYYHRHHPHSTKNTGTGSTNAKSHSTATPPRPASRPAPNTTSKH